MGKLPNGEECNCSWMEKAQAVCLVIAALGGLFTGIATLVIGALNSSAIEQNQKTIDTVKTEQEVVSAKAAEVKNSLDTRSVVTDKKLGTILETTKTLEESNGPSLWANWKYLQSIAIESDKAEDFAKAKEAKRVYDEFLKKPKN